MKLFNIEEARDTVFNGKSYDATLAPEFLSQIEIAPNIDFLIEAYCRRKRCVDRIEVIEMLGKKQESDAIEMLKHIVRT